MPQILDLKIPPDIEKTLSEALDPKQLRQAKYQIVSRTLAKLVTRIRKAVRDQNDLIKVKYVNREIEKISPRGDPPVGAIIVKAHQLPLTAFRVTESKRGGVRIRIARDLPPYELRHGFLATVGAGHIGVFLRDKGPPGGIKRDKNGQPRKYTPLGFAERLPIKQQFGPTLLKIIEIPHVLESIELDTAEEMMKQALSQLARFADPAAPAPPSDSPDAE